MTSARLLIGDVFDQLAGIPDRSVDLVVTSPPFLALRSYLPPDHPLKHLEIGSEATPARFLDTMLRLTDEFRRVLTPYGSICVELGDTYSGSGGAGGDYLPGGWRDSQERFGGSGRARSHGDGGAYDAFKGGGPGGAGWAKAKSLTGIPQAFMLSLDYGWNMYDPHNGWRGEPWRIRNWLTWCRPNPPVGALGDKFRPATSYVTVATMASDRWFDLDAVRGPGSDNTHARLAKGVDARPTNGKKAANPNNNYGSMDEVETAGAPPLDWDAPDNWDQIFQEALDEFLAACWQPLINLPTAPYKGAHYATFPIELPRRLIEAMCPRQVCTVCGEPRRRIVEQTIPRIIEQESGLKMREQHRVGGAFNGAGHFQLGQTTTLGWTDCHHGDQWHPGHVLDPFSGSGTTLAAAANAARDATGFDLDDRNVELSDRRISEHLYIRTRRLRCTGHSFAGAFSSWNRGPYERRPLFWHNGEWECDERVPRPNKTKRFDPAHTQRSLFDLIPA